MILKSAVDYANKRRRSFCQRAEKLLKEEEEILAKKAEGKEELRLSVNYILILSFSRSKS